MRVQTPLLPAASWKSLSLRLPTCSTDNHPCELQENPELQDCLPRIIGGPKLPGSLHHFAQTAVPSAYEVLHR